jgi:hypothetical protein
MPVRDRIGGTSLYTVATKDAAGVVDVINLRVSLAAAEARFCCVLGRFDVNAIGRTRGRAQKAGNAFFQPVLIPLQHVRAAIALFEPRRAVRIVLRDGRL